MFSNTQKQLSEKIFRLTLRIGVLASCAAFAFFLGLSTVGEVPHDIADAQVQGTTRVNVLLQYRPVGGGDVVPIEVTPVMNGSHTPLVRMIEIHNGLEYPSQCMTTSSTGRCSVAGVPVGGDPEAQYDLVANVSMLEFMTTIPFVQQGVSVLYDRTKCKTGADMFDLDGWCLTQDSEGKFLNEYFVTITLVERDVCVDITPPSSVCDAQGRLINFRCNQSFAGPTAPFEPVVEVCDVVDCPDGTAVPGMCTEVVSGVPACNSFAACEDHQLCNVQNLASLLPHVAGEDSIILRGERFGYDGGTVLFPTINGGSETVEVYPGQDWTDTEISIPIPLSAVSGELRIHPHAHGFIENGAERDPLTCTSQRVTIRGFADQFALLDVSAVSPDGVQLVSPGYETIFSIAARHNDRISRLDQIDIQLLQGAYGDPDALPLKRIVMARQQCSVQPTNGNLQEDILSCTMLIPEGAASYPGPFTFVITLIDDLGETKTSVLLDGGTSAMVDDYDFDHRISIVDAVKAMRFVRGVENPTEEHLLRDPNQDGDITIGDVLHVLNSLAQ